MDRMDENQDEIEIGEVHGARQGCFCRCLRMSFSGILLVLFAVSTGLQFNDEDFSIMWTLFYLLHVIIILLILALDHQRSTLTVEIIWTSLIPVIGVILWSLVLVVVSGWELARASSGGSEEGGDNPAATEEEEKAYELAGGCLGVFSAVYHGIMLKGYF